MNISNKTTGRGKQNKKNISPDLGVGWNGPKWKRERERKKEEFIIIFMFKWVSFGDKSDIIPLVNNSFRE